MSGSVQTLLHSTPHEPPNVDMFYLISRGFISSPEPTIQVSIFDRLLSVVRPLSVYPSVRLSLNIKLFQIWTSLEPLGQI